MTSLPFALLLVTIGAAAPLPAGRAPAPPNILFIFADDLGWSDAACYGNPWFKTPNIDRLAANGMRFTQAYSAAPICSASRAGMLTGKTPARLGFEFVTKMTDDPNERSNLARSNPEQAASLKRELLEILRTMHARMPQPNPKFPKT